MGFVWERMTPVEEAFFDSFGIRAPWLWTIPACRDDSWSVDRARRIGLVSLGGETHHTDPNGWWAMVWGDQVILFCGNTRQITLPDGKWRHGWEMHSADVPVSFCGREAEIWEALRQAFVAYVSPYGRKDVDVFGKRWVNWIEGKPSWIG